MRQKTSLTIVEQAIIDVPGFDPRPLQNYLKYKILTFLTSSFVVVEKFQSSLTIGELRFKFSCRLKSFRQKSFATVSYFIDCQLINMM